MVKPPFFIQSVFGILGGIGPHPEDVMHMKRTADRLFGDEYHWSVLGAGRNQMQIAAQAAAMGGNVRVGMEDSLWLGPGKLAESNAEQVTNVRKIIEGLGLEIASSDEAREMLQAQGRRQGGVLRRRGCAGAHLPPLAGRGWGWGKTGLAGACLSPPPLTPPRQGEGDRSNARHG